MRGPTSDGGRTIRKAERVAARLCSDLARLNYDFWSGRSRGGDPRPAFDRARALHGRRGVEALREAVTRARPGSEQDRRARALLAYALEVRALAARLPHDGGMAAAESAAVVRAAGAPVPLGRLRSALAREPDPRRRAEWASAADELVRSRLDPHLRRARDAELEALAEVGFDSRRAVLAEVERIDVATLAAAAREFLDVSRGRFRALLAARARGLGLDPARLGSGDVPALTATGASGGDGLASLAGALRGIGLDLSAEGRIGVDAEVRAGKSERSFCAPLRVPGDVRMVVGCDREGGVDASALLHEAGHALHRAWTRPELDVSSRLLGDASVTESYAFLFETLAPEPGSELRKLVLLRRHCALLVHELELERGWGREPEADARRRYAALMSAATGVECSDARALRDPDPGYYAARYLRGWMLAELWERDLAARYGPGWRNVRAVGGRLRELWSEGQLRDAERLAREEAGAERLGFEALAVEAGWVEAA